MTNMGCDIHIIVERRNMDTNAWHATDESGGDDRNYDVFNVLAGVRSDTAAEMAEWPNDTGKFDMRFCFSGRERRPIADPRGVPADASREARAYVEENGDHSTSHVTAREALYYPWATEIGQSGWIDGSQWIALRDGVKPTSWSQGIGGGGIVNLTAAEMEARVDGMTAGERAKTYARGSWMRAPHAGGFVAWVEGLAKSAQAEDPRRGGDDVRLVFSF